jgi:hypothetical protein
VLHALDTLCNLNLATGPETFLAPTQTTLLGMPRRTSANRSYGTPKVRVGIVMSGTYLFFVGRRSDASFAAAEDFEKDSPGFG